MLIGEEISPAENGQNKGSGCAPTSKSSTRCEQEASVNANNAVSWSTFARALNVRAQARALAVRQKAIEWVMRGS